MPTSEQLQEGAVLHEFSSVLRKLLSSVDRKSASLGAQQQPQPQQQQPPPAVKPSLCCYGCRRGVPGSAENLPPGSAWHHARRASSPDSQLAFIRRARSCAGRQAYCAV